ncbi:MAG TPA: glycoside hydrolase family 2 TIM barrel-domain containing protein [Bacteroidota bacterium]|nr:glycoside hydrolase family 2 TIM barrel-domain containing protein [Bacteroidota bacterium]
MINTTTQSTRASARRLSFAILIAMLAFRTALAQSASINLAGTWKFQIDSTDVGIKEQWFLRTLADTISLPGSMAQNGKGDPISINTRWTGGIVDRSWFTDPRYEQYRKPGHVKVPFWLNPTRTYVGPAWYQKTVVIPADWIGRNISLFLERCHWETELWVDETEVGTQNSLGTPHRYDLTRFLTPGKHRLTVRIDNRIKDIDVGSNAHSVSDHTQTNWNGVVGRIELEARPAVHLTDVVVIPHIHLKSATVRVRIESLPQMFPGGVLRASARLIARNNKVRPAEASLLMPASGFNSVTQDIELKLGSDARLWDEFDPSLYKLDVVFSSGGKEDRRSLEFGMREFRADGTRFVVNDRPVFLRGTLECAIFPKTGYASMDLNEWKRIFKVCKSYGLNHVRFHSWCPPEAAFTAADQAGIYCYVECCAWTRVGDGKPFDQWLYQESERIVSAYGNHPSFCMMSYGNEPSGDNQAKFLGEFVQYWKKKDPRRVYTSAAGWPQIPENDFHITDKPRIQHWGDGLTSSINSKSPTTDFDFRDIISQFDKPVVSHEIGQWCAYPNFAEIKKYTGVLRAKNFEIFRESLERNHMGKQAHDFLIASGKLQVLCYKADIEAALRTPGMAGFELLDLHDFPGQGTALVGVLDPFWQEKGYVTAKEYSRFCNSTVPLARLKRMIYQDNDMIEAAIEVAHFGPAPLLHVTPHWRIKDAAGKLMAEGVLKETNIPIGNATQLGSMKVYLDGWPTGRMNLEVSIGPFSNDWDFWIYPANPPQPKTQDLVIADSLNEQLDTALAGGKTVLLLADPAAVRSNVPAGFSSIFWNTAWTSGQAPHTLGILCDPKHPALRDFPTESHSNWQWWDLVTHARAMSLDSLPADIHPIVQVVDDWVTNRRLALVVEANVGAGKLIVCSVDLKSDLTNRPVARQLLNSLERYAASAECKPSHSMSIEQLKSLFR